MNLEAMTTSMPLYLLVGGGVLIVILVYLWMKRRHGTPPVESQQMPVEKEKKATGEETPAPQAEAVEVEKNEPEKPSLSAPRKERSEAPSAGGLPVYEKPIPEHEGIDRGSFAEFAGKRILTVDDNALNLKLIERLMEGSGIVMETASDGMDALQKLRAPDAHYDLVLMDVNMPKMDGLEATRQIRQDERLKDIPVLALTASTDKDEVERILASGMNGYLDKPLVLGKLFSAFKLFADRARQPKQTRVMVSHNGGENLVTNAEILNIRKGIEHSNSDETLYRTLLDEFLREYAECDRQYQEMVEAENYEKLHRLAVDLDGVSGP